MATVRLGGLVLVAAALSAGVSPTAAQTPPGTTVVPVTTAPSTTAPTTTVPPATTSPPTATTVPAPATTLPPTTPPAEGAVALHDVGPALGLPTDTHSWDVAVGRIDGDAVPDLVMGYHGTITVYLNRQPGLDPVFSSPRNDTHGCAIADIDGDGDGDVYCARGASHGTISKSNRLWIQDAGGGFADQAAAYGVTDPLGRGRRTTFFDLDHSGGPDLFVGNENPRSDGRWAPSRTYLNPLSVPLTDAALGVGAEGGLCAQAVDQNNDGWQDLLVCGGSGRATVGSHPTKNRLHLFRNRPDGEGRRLDDRAPALKIDLAGVESARLADLGGDDRPDLVVVQRGLVTIRPGLSGAGFGPVVFRRALQAGSWVTVGQIDGRNGLDLFVVQGCVIGSQGNVDDWLLVDRGPGWGYTAVASPRVTRGCGDTADVLDVDGDGRDDVVVGNGQWGATGPVQVLTTGPWAG